MWTEWFYPNSFGPILWVILGTVGMYLAILLGARLSGVRSFAEMSAFDIAVTIALGSLVASTVTAKTPALAQGVAAAATLFVIQLVASRLRIAVPGFTGVTDNTPILLVGPGGELMRKGMQKARVTESDLRSHLRAANVVDISTVQAVVMEGTGKIHVLHGHDHGAFAGTWLAEDVRRFD